MKKTLLLAAAALFTVSSAFADMYVVGGNVNGQDAWNSQANKMTESPSGVFTWTGTELGSGFKMNNGSWDNKDTNIGAPASSTNVTLGTAISYITGDAGENFTFDNFKVTNPKVVLDMNAKTVTVTGEMSEVVAPDPSDVTFYIIGTNVNGHNWALSEPDCAFTNEGNGIYRWEGEVLGTGFKINDGTWGDTYNIGAPVGIDLALGVPYSYVVGGQSGNIGLMGITEVANPVVVLNINEETITVTGEGGGEASWYIMGLNDNWDFIEAYELLPVEGKDGVFMQVVTITLTAGECKISDTGWAHERGTDTPEEVFISPDSMHIFLEEVFGEGGNIPYELKEGAYIVTWDENEFELTFAPAQDDAVDAITVANDGKVVYYNLQGQKVANPDKGIFIKVVDGKALKVVK